ncbi:uncharacterized protein LOC108733193 [Agrilus planipennis]|uniref:Uncharacterized protein LOC108733193 n=1 Tax=Agrilus planipennis TaxID=224129 RepID=A0A1W4WH32_AGRPL|nr:uncharacterized protein LOC108733193 [Agrilus planipennis]
MIKLMGKFLVLLALLACAFSIPLQGVKGGRRNYDSEVYVNPLRNDDYYNEHYGSRLEDRRYGEDHYGDRHRHDGRNRASGGQDVLTDEGRNRVGGPVGSGSYHQGENRSRGQYGQRSYDDQDVRYHGSQYRDNYDAEYVGSRGVGYDSRRQHGIKH